MPNDNQDQNQNQGNQGQGQAGAAQGAGNQQQGQQQQQVQEGSFQDIMTKKGFKDNEAFAANYSELEKDRSRSTNAFSIARTSVETQSQGTLTLDEKGNVIQKQGGQQQQGQQGQQGQYGQQQYGQQQEQVWDEQTQRYVNDPIEVSFAKAGTPLYQRQAMIAQAVIQQNEDLQRKSFTADQEVLTKPEAKGFEDDVRKVMQLKPLMDKANPEVWKQALLQVKGMKFDIMKQNAGQEGVDNFLNKEGAQGTGGAGGVGGQGGVQLSAEEEQTYKHYEQNNPGMFKDRAHFAKRSRSNTG